MVYNQLFKKIPDKNLLKNILSAFNIEDISSNKEFSRLELIEHNALEKIIDLLPILKEHYLPCKARTYLSELSYKNIITILRQILRVFNIKLNYKEKYIKGEKYIFYKLENQDNIVRDEVEEICVVDFS